MKMIIMVLNDIEKLDEFLFKLSEKGLKGATILSSTGMAKSIYKSEFSNNSESIIMNSLKILLNKNSDENRTIFTVVDEQQEKIFYEVVKEVVGSLEKENTGIIFTIPVDSIYGIAPKDSNYD